MNEGTYFLMDSNSLNSTPQSKIIMITRMMLCSKKIKNHLKNCNDCDVCKKIKCWMECFIKYEKDNNQTLNLEGIIDEEFVEEVIFSDKLMKIIS